MKEFNLMGGSYQDTQAGALFNNLFGDDKDQGEADYGGEDEYQNMADQMEEEIAWITREYNNKFKICHFYANVEESDGQPYVSYSGTVYLEIPDYLMVNPTILGVKEIHNAVNNWAKDNDIYSVNDVEVNGGDVRIDIYDEDGGLDPDSFRSFLSNELTNIDERANELNASLYHLFIKLGLAKENRVHHVASNWDDHRYQFQNFTWGGDEPEIEVSLKAPIVLHAPIPSTLELAMDTHWQEQFKKLVMQELNIWADRIHSQPSLFKGTEWKPSRAFKNEFAIKPEIKIMPVKDIIAMYMNIAFEPFTKDEDFHDVIDFVGFLDKNYQRFTTIINNIYTRLVGQFSAGQPNPTIPKP